MVIAIIPNFHPPSSSCVGRTLEDDATPSNCVSDSVSERNWWKRRWKITNSTTNSKENDYFHHDNYYDECRLVELPSSSSDLNLNNHDNHHLRDEYHQYDHVDFRSSSSSTVTNCHYQIHQDHCNNNNSTIENNRIPQKSCFIINNVFQNKDFSRKKNIFNTLLSFDFVTFLNFLVIFTILSSAKVVQAYPATDCDWIGSGTPENVVQAVYLGGCHQGQILWERPRGGLRVNISPPRYSFKKSSSQQPFRLCLESHMDSTNFQVYLEQTDSNSLDSLDQKILKPFISHKTSSTCYRISSSTATLYIESQNQHDDSTTTSSTKPQQSTYQVKISYEIEELKSREQFSDDECRPCSDEEVLQLYCVADVVAKGEILSVRPNSQKKRLLLDTLHIKSNLVVHQNHPVFQPLKPGSKNLHKFLAQEMPTFDQSSPKKVSKSSSKSLIFGGIVSHPAKCAAQSGPGEFLWLIKLSFGRPKIGCVVYWDRWVQLAKDATKSGIANCKLSF